MSSILNNLGVDEEDFEWYHLALCDGMDTNLFYDKYESDINIAKNIEKVQLEAQNRVRDNFIVNSNKIKKIFVGIILTYNF